MFSIIKWGLYACAAVIVFCIIQEITTAETSQKFKQNIALLNQRVESMFSQINDGVDELSEQTAKIMK
ncbi:MAG: hypothetical protein J6N49_01165 [Alphaproteobacteria bacterium]|nr:hypothetical protein [Alphaproteobacteria bacterium]